MTMLTMKRAGALSAAVAASLGVAVPVMAQNASDTPSESATTMDEISEIIVTARRTEERLQDVPISITVFNQEQLTNRNVTTATDLANFTPSLSANNNFGTENTTFAIRGFVQDASTPPSVGNYFADVVVPRAATQGTQAGDSFGPGSFFDLQNVQVLKGPQGTLQGRNTTGGAVLLVPQKPTYNFEGYVEASAGNYDMQRIQGVLNTPFSDSVRFRLAVDHQDRDGYVKNVSGIGPDSYNDIDYTAVRASLVVDVLPNVENYTIASYSKSDTNGSVQKLIGCDPRGTNPLNPALGAEHFIGVFSCGQLATADAAGDGFHDVRTSIDNPVSRLEQWQVINTTTWSINDELTLKNIASYAEFKEKQRTALFGVNWRLADLPPTYQGIFGAFGIPSGFTGIYPAPGLDTADQSTYTEELQLQGASADRRLVYQAGVYFEWSDPESLIGNQSPQLAVCSDLAALQCSDPIGTLFTAGGHPVSVGAVNYTAGRTSFRDRGVYAQSTYEFTDQFKVTAGARYTWDKQENTSQRISYNFAPFTNAVSQRCTDPSQTATNCRQSLEAKSDKPTWLIDFDYKPVDDMLLYAKYARGYRAGGISVNGPIDYRTFDPEKVDAYEVGMKTSWRGDLRGTLNVAAFYNDFSNQQLQFGFDTAIINGVPAPVSPTSAIVNAGKSRIYGAEVESSITPVDGLTFDVSYTYLKAEIRSIAAVATVDPNYQVQTSELGKGTPLLLSPKHKVAVSGTYALPTPDSLGAMSVGATYVYTSSQLTSYAYIGDNNILPGLFGGNLAKLDSRGLLNLSYNWTGILGSTIDGSLFATNVTNKDYYNFVPGLASSGSEYATLGEPRMYGLRVRFRFGE